MTIEHGENSVENNDNKKGRISVSLTGSSFTFVEGFAERHPDIGRTHAKIVGLGLMLLKLSEELGPDEVLSVVDRETGVSRPVVLPWREDTNRVHLPPL